MQKPRTGASRRAEPSHDAPADGTDVLPQNALRRFLLGADEAYHLTRFAILRLLGLIYAVAFSILVLQGPALLGERGLMPAHVFLERVAMASGSRWDGFLLYPSFFWLGCSDAAMRVAAWSGLLLSLAVIAGVTNAVVQLVLWATYMSFVHVGQTFWGYGWELQLLETGFLSVFLCPLRTLRPLPDAAPPRVVVWLFRWLIVRVMLGAGLIKLRGDDCWTELTCLEWHYETQPNPTPLAWLLHQAPPWFHALGVLVNHVVELVAPFFAFGPRRARHVAGIAFIAFQVFLIASGNLSFLNWLTIVPALACFDDRALSRLAPARLAERARELADLATNRVHRAVSWVLGFVVAILSVNPVSNLLSSRQAMNRSFEPLALVNTYGAFGSVGDVRHEVVLQGTADEELDDDTVWLDYELPCKPGDVRRRPCIVTPYHYRLDWQMWFAALSSVQRQPWLVHLVYKLLQGEPEVRSLLAYDPFPNEPPRWIRAVLFRYQFTRIGDGSDAWWTREPVGTYLRPLRADDPELLHFLAARGWLL